ncbi:hypothetical protein PENCOP_c009G07042 [Penicillium coprophilum]|uniref:Uncharacterized protein n=1 Tax=Penicillium coprophilum TaxID=36646 RepID=A0A1V6UIT7_9EURO|nr:hypothetical protein PENCOP_c009G07042 [Penicillium coprophilum]
MATSTGSGNMENVANEIATYLYGSSATARPGPGSYYNPNALQFNCAFVSIAFILGMTAPQLSKLTDVPEPTNAGMGVTAMKRLLEVLREKGLIWGCAVSKLHQPYVYHSYAQGPRAGEDRYPQSCSDGLYSSLNNYYYTHAPSGFSPSIYHLVLYERPDSNRTHHCIVSDEYKLTDYQHVVGEHKQGNGTDVTWELEHTPQFHRTFRFLTKTGPRSR